MQRTSRDGGDEDLAANQYNFYEVFSDFVGHVNRHFSGDWLHTSADGAGEGRPPKDLAPFDVQLDFESHTYMEMCICVKGELGLEFRDHLCHLRAGEVCLIFAGHEHREHPVKGGSHDAIWVLANLDIITLMLTSKQRERREMDIDWAKSFPQSDIANRIFATLRTVREEKQAGMAHAQDYCRALVLQILILLLRSSREMVQDQPAKSHWRAQMAQEVQAYIEENYAQSITLADISQKMCISANYLNGIFKAVTGKTIIRYAEETRVVKAKWFLKETDNNISQIAAMLGYCDPYHFSKSFKKMVGCTPTEYRK